MSGRRIARRLAWAAMSQVPLAGRVFALSLATKVLGLRPSPLLGSPWADGTGIRGGGRFGGGQQGSQGGCCRVVWRGIAAATTYPSPSLVTKEGMGGGR